MSSVTKGRTAATLAALVVVLVLMIGYGWRAASKPFPSLAKAKTPCQTVQLKKTIARHEITVSVYNASKRQGLADRTMSQLERRKFHAGAVGNATDDMGKVDFVQVMTTVRDDPAATLVAEQFKPTAKVVVTQEDFGPGIDVVLGPKYKRLFAKAPNTMKLQNPKRTCLDKVTADPNAGGA